MAYEMAGLLFGMFNRTKISMVRRNVGYFPLNTACLIGILMMVYEIIPTSLGSISSREHSLNNQGPFSFIAQVKPPHKKQSGGLNP